MKIFSHKELFLSLLIFSLGFFGLFPNFDFLPSLQDAQAAPALQTFSFARSASGTSINGSRPAGTASGDLLIAIMTTDGGGETLTAPGGWTVVTGNIGSNHTSRSWYKIAGASEPASYTFTVGSNEAMTIGILRLSGHDLASPINVFGISTGASTSPTAPSVTTTVNDALILRYYGADDDDYTGDDTGYPPAHTGIYRRQSGGTRECHQGAAYTTQLSAGTTGTAAFSQNQGEQWSAVTIAIAPLPATYYNISGTVYEDVNGDSNLADGAARSGVTVMIYRDNGDAVPSVGDLLFSTTTTNGSGVYSVAVPDSNTYWVVVDSKTIPPSNGFTGGSAQGDVWAEQTYGPLGALCSDGAGGTYERASAGPCFGGRRGGQSDNAATLNNAEHVGKVAVNGSNVTTVDFGFSFNVVTDSRDGDDDAAANRTVQGSLRQYIQNANAIGNANTMRFVPAAPANASGSGGVWWTVALTNALPSLTDGNTTINGTAYSYTNGVTLRNTNPGTAGHSGQSVGTGMDGVEGTGDDPTLPSYQRPEIEINGGDFGRIFQLAGNNQILRLIAIFNTENSNGVNVTAGTGSEILECFIGPRADGTDPGNGSRLYTGVVLSGGAADITDNYLAHTRNTGIMTGNTSVVSGNDCFNIAIDGSVGDGITAEGSSGQTITFRENRVDGVGAFGLESWQSPGPFTFENNTVLNTGRLAGQGEDGGIRIFGNNSLVRYNVVSSAVGAGIVVAPRSSGASTHNTISKNAVYNNGGLSIDLDQTPTGNPSGDDVTPNDGITIVGNQNDGFDYPVFTVATLSGTTLHMEGYVGTVTSPIAGTHIVEVFKADDDGNNNGEIEQGDGQSVPHGEGRYYIGSFASNADGTFSANMTLTGSVSVVIGDFITATATDSSGNTSELSGNRIITGAPDILLLKTVQAFSDPVNDTTNPKAIPGAVMLYTIVATNQGGGAVTANSVVVTDPIPVNTELYVGDDTVSPVAFIDGGTVSGLNFTFTSLSSTTDDISFSDDGGGSFNYSPAPIGYDGDVTHIRINPKGPFNGASGGNNPSFEIRFQVRVE